ncbi:hypothetical protein [Nocardia nepalensis]|uniref:hypothetical protein n=1 Tax=Nocardia nepalensis TaxID=3375448 RepID=UPI003B684C3D
MISVLVIVAVVQVIAIIQLRRLNLNLDRGNEWIANRFALAVQNGGAKAGSGSGSGGGTALGMGNAHAGGSMHGLGFLATLGAASTIANSPLTEWAMLGIPGSWRPQSKLKRDMAKQQAGFWNKKGTGGAEGEYAMSYMNRSQFMRAARQAAREYPQFGRRNTYRSAAAALRGVEQAGGGRGDALGALTGAGFTNNRMKDIAIRTWGIVDDNAEDETLANKQLGHVVAATQEAQRQAYRLVNGTGGSTEEVAAAYATLEQSVFRFRRANYGGVRLDGGAAWGEERAFVMDYMGDPANGIPAAQTEQKIKDLQNLRNGDLSVQTSNTMLANITPDQAGRMMDWIGNEHALRTEDAVARLIANPTSQQALRDVREQVVRATDTDQWQSGAPRTSWNNLAPPDPRTPINGDWARRLRGVTRLLNY